MRKKNFLGGLSQVQIEGGDERKLCQGKSKRVQRETKQEKRFLLAIACFQARASIFFCFLRKSIALKKPGNWSRPDAFKSCLRSPEQFFVQVHFSVFVWQNKNHVTAKERLVRVIFCFYLIRLDQTFQMKKSHTHVFFEIKSVGGRFSFFCKKLSQAPFFRNPPASSTNKCSKSRLFIFFRAFVYKTKE